MNQKTSKRLLSCLLALAMIVTGSLGSLTISSKADAKKTATVKLKKSKVTLLTEEKITLKVVTTNVKKVKSQKWSTSSKKIAVVSSKGVVTAKKAGKATIRCRVSYIAKDSKRKSSKILSCTVTVKDDNAETIVDTDEPVGLTPVPVVSAAPPVTDATPTATDVAPVVTDAVSAVTANPTKTSNPNPTNKYNLTVKWDDTTNIGEERTVTIKGGTSDSMVVKDNGEMRKDLSSQWLIANEMGQGINLGNTMEATQSLLEKDSYTEATDFETAWGSSIITQEVIDGIHSYGFNTIRIPVAWSNMVDLDDETFTIDEKYLGRVEEIVNYALNDGMYVIINDHWDSGWWGEFGATYRDADKKKQVWQEWRDKAWVRYEAYWTQIAERFKDYSDHLIFEGANEELGDRLNDGIHVEGYSEGSGSAVSGNLTKDECYELTNKINQKFVDIVRKSGGNNAYRHLLIPGYNTDIDATTDSRFVMPTDTEENGVSKLSLSVHYYTPWAFCGDNQSGTYTDGDREVTKTQLAKMSEFTDQGYGIILGEYGVCNPRQEGVCDWLLDVMYYCNEDGILPVMWDSAGRYYNRLKCEMKYYDVGELYNSVTGARGDTSMSTKTGPPVAATTVDTSTLTSQWDWSGKWYKNDGSNTVGDDRTEKVNAADKSKFVPVSDVTVADESNTTVIDFNDWGYRACITLDISKYQKPAISFDFAQDDEDTVGDLTLWSAKTVLDSSASVEEVVSYSDFKGKAVVLSDELLDDLYFNPYLCLTFANMPTVTGIHIYETAN